MPLGSPLVTRPTTHMTSPLLTLQLYTFSLPPLYNLHALSKFPLYILIIVYCHGTPPFSSSVTRPSPTYDQPPFYTPSLHSLSIHFIYLPTIRYCCNGAAQLPLGSPLVTRPTTHMTSPLLTLQLYTFSLPPLYNLHALSKFPLYILIIVYCHGTAQSPLGSPPVTRQPPLYD